MTTCDASNVTLLQLGDAEPPRPGQEVYGRPSANRADHTQVRFWSTDVERDVAELSASGAVFEDYDFPALKTVDHIATTPGIGQVCLYGDEHRVARNGALVVRGLFRGPQVLHDGCVVMQTPVLNDDPVQEAIEDHRPELDSLAGRGHAKEFPLVGTLVAQLKGDPVVLRDQGLDRRVEVGERPPPSADPDL